MAGGAPGGDLGELKGQVETRAAGRSYTERHLEPEGPSAVLTAGHVFP